MLPNRSTNRTTSTISGSGRPMPPFRGSCTSPAFDPLSRALRGFGAEVDCPPGSRISPQSHAKVASRDPRRWVRVVCQPYLLQLRSTGAVVHQNVILDRAPDVTDQKRQDDGAPGRTGRTQRMSRVLHCAAVIRTLPQTVRSRHSLGRLSDKATCKGWLRPT
jgi:hypothetical protein